MILNNYNDLNEASAGDKAEGASGDVDTRNIKRDASLYNTFATLELPSEPHGVPSALAQA